MCTTCGSPEGHIPVQEMGTGKRGILCLHCFMERSVFRSDPEQSPQIRERDFFKHHAAEQAEYLINRVIRRKYPTVEFIEKIFRTRYKVPTVMTVLLDYLTDCCSTVDPSLSRYLKIRDLSVRFSYVVMCSLQNLPDSVLRSLWKNFPDYHREFILFLPYHFIRSIQFKYDEMFRVRDELVSVDVSNKMELEAFEPQTDSGKEYRSIKRYLKIPSYWGFFLWKLTDFCVSENGARNHSKENRIVFRELLSCLQS